MVWIISIFLSIVFLLILFLRWSCLLVHVDGESMLPVYRPGDRVIAVRWKAERLQKDQIVLVRRPQDAEDEHFPKGPQYVIKRVAALPGETICGERNATNTDGSASKVPFEWTVPPDHFFVLGDNREKSLDSRYWGPLPFSSLIGIVAIRLGRGQADPEAVQKIPLADILGKTSSNFIAYTLEGRIKSFQEYWGRRILLFVFYPLDKGSVQLTGKIIGLEPQFSAHHIDLILIGVGKPEEIRTVVNQFQFKCPVLSASEKKNPFLRDMKRSMSACGFIADEKGMIVSMFEGWAVLSNPSLLWQEYIPHSGPNPQFDKKHQ